MPDQVRTPFEARGRCIIKRPKPRKTFFTKKGPILCLFANFYPYGAPGLIRWRLYVEIWLKPIKEAMARHHITDGSFGCFCLKEVLLSERPMNAVPKAGHRPIAVKFDQT